MGIVCSISRERLHRVKNLLLHALGWLSRQQALDALDTARSARHSRDISQSGNDSSCGHGRRKSAITGRECRNVLWGVPFLYTGRCNESFPRLTTTKPAAKGRKIRSLCHSLAVCQRIQLWSRCLDFGRRSKMKTACPDFGRADQRDEKRLLGYRNSSQRKIPFVNFIERHSAQLVTEKFSRM